MKQEELVFYAFRYCLLRSTHAVFSMQEHLRECWGDLSPYARQKIKDEIQEALVKRSRLSGMDAKSWSELLEELSDK